MTEKFELSMNVREIADAKALHYIRVFSKAIKKSLQIIIDTIWRGEKDLYQNKLLWIAYLVIYCCDHTQTFVIISLFTHCNTVNGMTKVHI